MVDSCRTFFWAIKTEDEVAVRCLVCVGAAGGAPVSRRRD